MRKQGEDSFSELIDGVGDVRPLKPSVAKALPPKDSKAVTVVNRKSSAPLTVETINDIVVAHAPSVPARLAHDLRAGPKLPYRELDLHRMTAQAARRALDQAVRLARRDGMRTLVVVCGKGSHSGAAGPVLPQVAVEELSGPLADAVLAFRTAPPRFGGHGAFLVLLKKLE